MIKQCITAAYTESDLQSCHNLEIASQCTTYKRAGNSDVRKTDLWPKYITMKIRRFYLAFKYLFEEIFWAHRVILATKHWVTDKFIKISDYTFLFYLTIKLYLFNRSM